MVGVSFEAFEGLVRGADFNTHDPKTPRGSRKVFCAPEEQRRSSAAAQDTCTKKCEDAEKNLP